MITLTSQEQDLLNLHYAGVTIDESKNSVPEGADAGNTYLKAAFWKNCTSVL